MKGSLRRALVVGIVALLLGAIGSALFQVNISADAAGATIFVDADNVSGPWDGTVSNPYQNITSGLEHASDGDTVLVLNGTYNENVVVNKSVALMGDSNPLINGMSHTYGINITVNNVIIEGFNITNSYYGVYCSASGFSVANNIFWYDAYGFYWRIDENSLAEDYTVYASTVENNEFYMNTNFDAVSVNVGINYGYDIGYNANIGDTAICNNTFYLEGTSATGINVGQFYVFGLYGGTVTLGDLNVSGNTIYGGYMGVELSLSGLQEWKDVQARVGDVIVNDNVLVNQSGGIYSYGLFVDYYDGSYWYGDTVGTYGDLVIRGNTITSMLDSGGIQIGTSIDAGIGYWSDFYNTSSIEVGNLYIEDNTIDVYRRGIGLIGEYAGSWLYDDSSVTIGNISIKNNTVNSNHDSGMQIYLEYFGYEIYDNSSVTMGNIQTNDNTVNGNFAGIYCDCEYFGEEMYGASSFTMNDIECNRNIINANTYGTTVYVENFGYYMEDDSSFTMGHIRVNDNTINSGDTGMYVDCEYMGNDMYGTSAFTMSNIECCGNAINSTNYGIYPTSYSLGYNMHDDSSFAMGDFLINNNTIGSAWGIHISSLYGFGFSMYDNSSFTMGNVQIENNVIVRAGTYTGIYINNLNMFGFSMYGNSSFTMGHIHVSNNIINSSYGIYVERFYLYGSNMYGTSYFAMGNVLVNGNIINGSFGGIFLLQNPYTTRFGYNVQDNASFTMGKVEFGTNTISNSSVAGMRLTNLENASIIKNTMQYCSYGIDLQNSANNSVYHNNFINNTIQATVTPNYNDTWDNGYPSGGNYWSDYNGTDQYKGSNQDILGSDFIGDTPYAINTNNTDHYPLMIPHETTPPTITILSPENTTYAVNASIPLTFTVDEITNWMGYSLNGQTNVTITGNTTLPTLPDGWHYVAIYANDTFDNMGFAIVYFTVDTTKPDITNVVQYPPTNILPDTVVKINATITDATSGIKQALLNCTFTNSTDTWGALFSMAPLTGNIWNGTILALPDGTNVTYVIIAEDNAGNTITTEQKYGYEYEYLVVPDFQLLTTLFAFMIVTTFLIIVFRKKRPLPRETKTNSPFCHIEY